MAIAGLKEVQGSTKAGVPVAVSEVEPPLQNIKLAAGVVIVGEFETVTVIEALLNKLSVYVIVVDPPETAVTNPVASTVATAGLEDTHGFIAAGIPKPVNCVVVDPGKQILGLPVITPNGVAK